MKRGICLLLLSLWGVIGCRGVLEVRLEREPTSQALSLGKVACIVGGEVKMVDLDTHRHVRLTYDGRNCCPRWSPDGRWIAYRKEEGLWAVEVKTEREWRIHGGPVREFVWSPVENHLAFSTTDGLLAVWEPRQKDTRVLVESSMTFTIGRWAWKPDGQEVAYDFQGITWGLGKISLKGGVTTVYTASDGIHLPRLAGWSPDGRWLLAWVGPPSATAEADGMPLCWIPAEGGPPRCLEQKVLLHPDWLSWSPKGPLALIVGEGRETWVNKGLALVEPETLSIRWLISPPEQAPVQPAFSPDGAFIAYSAGPPTPMAAAYARRDDALSGRRIWMVDLASGQKRPITNDARYRDERPVYSFTGTHILFVRLDERGAGLWLMKTDGGQVRPVVPELTPRPDPLSEYGHIEWQTLWQWWQPFL